MRGGMKRFVTFLLLIVFVLTGCSSQKTIVNNLEERDANEIMVFLANKGIPSSKVPVAEGGAGAGPKVPMYDIQVPEDKSVEAMAMLNMAGLPRRRGQSLLGIFTGGGLVPSQMEEKIRYQQGLAQDIANTIRKIDGVIDADVQLSFPEEDPLNPEKNMGQVTASVYVKHNGVLDDPNAHLVTKIRRLVASSIPGLKFDNVTVIGDRARFTSGGGETAVATSADRGVVSIWSVLVAKESVSRFQIVFFTFLILISLLLAALAWLIWKFYLLIQRAGGFSSLFSLHPIDVDQLSEESEEVQAEEGEATPKEGEEAAAEGQEAAAKEEPPKGAK